MNERYSMSNAAIPYMGQAQSAMTAGYADAKPPQPTVFSRCAAKLEAQVAHVNGLVDRASHVADRLGGSIPQSVDEKKNGLNGSHIAAQMEISMEMFDTILRRFEHTIERLESL